MPKLWNETIEAHRAAVHDAILETTAALVAEHGLTSVTMSQVAKEAGIGRATLYKYFPDVEAILLAWHANQISSHLDHLAHVGERFDEPGKRLEAVLEAYAHIHQRRAQHHRDGGRHGIELSAFLHQDSHLAGAQRHLHEFFRGVLTEAAQAGEIRDDVAPDVLVSYCLHALAAAGTLASQAAVHRLVTVTLAGLRPAR